MHRIHSVSELMNSAAEALSNRDADTLERLQTIPRGWLQPDQERTAQEAMLTAMLDACYALERLN